ncbi:hypothetical protein FQN54_003237 [Arachnomyces sp. PD_36]|nr:hypothetical protein FQN54_003237 [Arachnomyces sp. PD_36]
MSSKPQRPTRTVRVRDENIPIHAAPNKTLHHRNKSTPALSNVLGNVALKNTTNNNKRTAFGDVSNVVNPVRASRDDSAIAKDTSNKPAISVAQEKQLAALSRPAQRPASIANLKGLLNNVTNSNKPSSDKSSINGADSRKGLVKRSNTVFKDPALPSVVEATKPAKTVESNVVARSLPSVPVANVTSKHPVHDVKHIEHVNFSAPADVVDTREALRSDGTYINDNGEVKYSKYEEANIRKEVIKSSTITSDTKEHSVEMAKPAINEASNLKSDHLAIPSEPEEYWDDEEEDNYEEDDYVTAPSHRYRGDNTTGGQTTVLFPRFNQKAKRELAVAKQIIDASRDQEDIADELWDTTMVAEYGDEIFQYMKDLEIKLLPNADYMNNQAEIQWSMRSVLMDWLVQVHHRFALLPETLFLCVNYIDRFLSCKIVSLGKLQLVGATAIFIASKYEEINCPSLNEIVFMVDNGYTADEILKAERFMLSMLQFELGWPGPMSFLRRISKADDYDLETRTLAKYLLEITIMDERFVGTPPSFTAAGAHCLARLMLRKGIWTPAHVHWSGYTFAQLHPLACLILECCQNARKHHAAIFDKYTDRRFKRASLFVETEVKRSFRVMDVPREAPSYSTLSAMVNHGYAVKMQ